MTQDAALVAAKRSRHPQKEAWRSPNVVPRWKILVIEVTIKQDICSQKILGS